MTVAKKSSALRAEGYIAERSARADVGEALRILNRIGIDKPPMPGDEIEPEGRQRPAPSRKRRATPSRSR
jgi:hypothetical protein